MKKLFIFSSFLLFSWSVFAQTIPVNRVITALSADTVVPALNLPEPIFLPANYPSSGIFISAAGSDSNNGTSYSTPIKTITKLNTLTLTSSSTVYFRRGDIFQGQINLSVSGASSSAPILVDSYGYGPLPIISGAVSLKRATWTSEGSGIFSTPYSTQINSLVHNGKMMTSARSSGFYTITAVPATNQLTCSGFPSFSSTIVGAKIIYREYDWTYAQATVTAYNSGTKTLTMDRNATLITGYGIILFNQQQFLDATEEWYWDDPTDKLYFKPANGLTPALSDVYATTFDYGIKATAGIGNVSISNLEFRYQGKDAIFFKSGNNVTVQDCRFQNILYSSISNLGVTSGFTARRNVHSHMGSGGILLGAATGYLISGETIQYVGMEGLPGTIYDPSLDNVPNVGINISFESDKGVIEDSYLRYVGYNGISMCGTNSIARRNQVYDYCQKACDGAGIYSFGFETIGRPAGNNQYLNNICIGGLGSQQGSNGLGPNNTSGIYLDNSSHDCLVEGNHCANNTYAGILVNPQTRNNTLRRNVCRNNQIGQIILRERTGYSNYGNVLEANTMIAGSSTQACLYVGAANGSSFSPFATGGRSQQNVFSNQFSTNIARYNDATAATNTDYTLSGLRTKYSLEGNSIAYPQEYAQQRTAIFTGLFNTPTAVPITTTGSYTPETGTITAIGTGLFSTDGSGNLSSSGAESLTYTNNQADSKTGVRVISMTGTVAFSIIKRINAVSRVRARISLSGSTLTCTIFETSTGGVETSIGSSTIAYTTFLNVSFQVVGTACTLIANELTVSATTTITTQSTNTEVYSVNAAGVLIDRIECFQNPATWTPDNGTDPGFGGGAATPGGSTGQVQYNNAGVLGGASSLFFDNTNNRLGIADGTPTYRLSITNTSNLTQLRVANTTGDAGGGFLTSVGGVHLNVGAGASFNGTSYVAKNAAASSATFGSTGGTFLLNTGLTIGNTFTQTAIWNYGANGIKIGDATAPTAKLEIAAATSSVAALGLTSGTDLSSPTAGKFYYNGTRLGFSPSTTIKRIALTNDATPTNGQINIGNGTDYTVATPTGSNGITVTTGSGTLNFALTQNAPVAGSFSGTGTATTTFTVTIGATQANTTYKVNVTPTDALAAAVFYVNNKTTTTFDVVYLAGLTGAVSFDWAVFP